MGSAKKAATSGKRAFALGTLLLVVLASALASLAAKGGCIASLNINSNPASSAQPSAPLLLGRGPGGHHLAAARAAAAAAAAPGKPAQWQALGAAHGIPRILHRIYIADPADKKRSNFTMPIGHQHWLDSCAYHYSRSSGWQMMYWDWHNTHALIANHYPWFLPFFRLNATKMVEKSDLARYAVLHRLGGLYLDSDVECWREGGDMLDGFDLVAQSTNKAERTTNAMIAARPGLAVFTKALQLVQHRVGKDGKRLGVIERTANMLFADALEAVGVQRGKDGLFQRHTWVEGAVYRLYRSGTWFQPCEWFHKECRRSYYRQRAAGQVNMTELVGWHRMVGSWIYGKEDGIGIVNTTAELCGGASHERGNGQVGGWVAPKIVGGGQQQQQGQQQHQQQHEQPQIVGGGQQGQQQQGQQLQQEQGTGGGGDGGVLGSSSRRLRSWLNNNNNKFSVAV